MKRLLRSLLVFGWYALAALLVAFATLVSVGQYYFPYLGRHSDALIARATAELPFTIAITDLRAEWTGMAPTFYANGFALRAHGDAEAVILRGSSAELSIDLLRSLFAGAPRLRRMSVENVELNFVQAADGRWTIGGLRGGRRPPNADAIVDFFLAVEEIDLRHAGLSFESSNGSQVQTQDAQLRLENYQRFRRLRLDARDPGQDGRLTLLVESHGDPRKHHRFRAAAWVDMERVDLARWQPLFGIDTRVPQLSGQLWADIDEDRQVRFQGHLRAPRFALSGQDAAVPLQPLEGVELDVSAAIGDSVATLWVERATANWYGQALALEKARMTVARPLASHHYDIAAEYIDIGAIGEALRAASVLPPRAQQALSDLAPYGGLGNVQFALQLPSGGKPEFTLRARLIDVSVSPWTSAPGIRNAAGYLELHRDGGFVDLDAGAITLEFPRLYDQDIDLASARGHVGWHYDADGVRVTGDRIHVAYGSAEADAYFNLQYRADPALDDEFALAIGLRHGNAAMRAGLVPKVLNPNLRRWLDTSIEAGEVDAAALAFHAIFTQPDRPGSSAVQLAFDVRDASLTYHPDWPAVRDVDGYVQVDGHDIRVWARQGRLLDSNFADTLVEVTRRDDALRVRVDAALSGDVGDAVRVINDSPLTALTGGALRNWQASGLLNLDLDLDIPLGRPLQAGVDTVRVAAAVAAAELYLGDQNLRFTDVHGALNFDLAQGLRSEDLRGWLWDRAVRAAVAPMSDDAHSLRVAVDGTARIARVADWLAINDGDRLDGEARFLVALERPTGGVLTTSVYSDLVGIGSRLPVPFAKAAESTLPLQLQWHPEDGETAMTGSLGGDLARAALRLPRKGRLRGTLALGGGGEPVVGEDLVITGHLASADISAWAEAARALLASNPPQGDTARLRPRISQLDIADATLLGGSLGPARVDAHWRDDAFLVGLDAADVQGELALPRAGEAPLALTLQRLQLAPFLPAPVVAAAVDPAAPAAVAEPPAPASDPDWPWLHRVQLPAVTVDIAALALRERPLGAWSFRIESFTDEVRLSALQASMPGMALQGLGEDPGATVRLQWMDDHLRTSFAGRAQFGDIGAFFAAWGYGKVLESRTGKADLALSWPGNPAAFRLVQANGIIDFQFRDGRLVEASGNNPIMRALGLLSVDEILRRLEFNFRDFYQSGLGYDRFEGALDIGEGIAVTRDPVQFKGPSVRLRVNGQSDLRAQTIDADLIATLPIGSNLPWVAALAAGPAAAAGAYVASRILENPIGRFSSAVYTMSGPLDAPNLQLKKVFDLEKARAAKGAAQATPAPEASAPAPEVAAPAAEASAPVPETGAPTP